MARAYTVATAALALQVTPKWVDNILSHHQVQGVTQARQGVPRRLSVQALAILSITLDLMRDLELPAARALNVASALLQSEGRIILPTGATIELDVERVGAAVLERLEHAVEVAPLPRRGRPPQKATGRLE